MNVNRDRGSRAEDAGTDMRNARFVLTRCLNSLAGKEEVSAALASYLLLERGAEHSSHNHWYIFANPAFTYVWGKLYPSLDTVADGSEDEGSLGQEESDVAYGAINIELNDQRRAVQELQLLRMGWDRACEKALSGTIYGQCVQT
tara:strand:- start:55 stop:489 length:435 start_codon:yes stop_codon:yes gene_type:complete